MPFYGSYMRYQALERQTCNSLVVKFWLIAKLRLMCTFFVILYNQIMAVAKSNYGGKSNLNSVQAEAKDPKVKEESKKSQRKIKERNVKL